LKKLLFSSICFISLALTSCASASTLENVEGKLFLIGNPVVSENTIYEVTSASLTDKRGDTCNFNTTFVAKIEYTIKNDSNKNISIKQISAYTIAGIKLESSLKNSTDISINPGEQVTNNFCFGLNQIDEIEIQFEPFSAKDTVSFKVTPIVID